MQTPAFKNTVDTTIRLVLLMLLIAWCLTILLPFLTPVIWGLIIAVSLAPMHVKLTQLLNGRNKWSAAIITIILLAMFIVPAALFATSMYSGAEEVGKILANRSLKIPPPKENIADWPVIGKFVFELWSDASTNLQALLAKYSHELATAGKWILNAMVGTGFGIVMLFLSIVVSGIFLINNKSGEKLMHNFSVKMMGGERAIEIGKMAELTVRNVTKGVLGVSFIQSFLAGIGFVLAGVPYAGLWAVLCFFFAIIQIGPGLVILPVIGYLWYVDSGILTIVFTVYLIFVLLVDNILKPMLLGKGAPVPMLVIFLGSLGGFMATGFLGLFTGAVVLSLGYTLFMLWINGAENALEEEPNAVEKP